MTNPTIPGANFNHNEVEYSHNFIISPYDRTYLKVIKYSKGSYQEDIVVRLNGSKFGYVLLGTYALNEYIEFAKDFVNGKYDSRPFIGESMHYEPAGKWISFYNPRNKTSAFAMGLVGIRGGFPYARKDIDKLDEAKENFKKSIVRIKEIFEAVINRDMTPVLHYEKDEVVGEWGMFINNIDSSVRAPAFVVARVSGGDDYYDTFMEIHADNNLVKLHVPGNKEGVDSTEPVMFDFIDNMRKGLEHLSNGGDRAIFMSGVPGRDIWGEYVCAYPGRITSSTHGRLVTLNLKKGVLLLNSDSSTTSGKIRVPATKEVVDEFERIFKRIIELRKKSK